VVFPKAHGSDESSEGPLTIGRQEMANLRGRRGEAEESQVQNVGAYHDILPRRAGRSCIGRANILW